MRRSLAIISCVILIISAYQPSAKANSLFSSSQTIPVWFGPSGYSKQGLKALDILENSSSNGIPPSHYQSEKLQSYKNFKTDDLAKIKDINDTVTHAITLYMLDLRFGVNQSTGKLKSLTEQDHLAYQNYFNTVLNTLVSEYDYDQFLNKFSGQSDEYLKLKQSLANFNNLKNKNSIQKITSKKPLALGDDDSQVALISTDVQQINSAIKSKVEASEKRASANEYGLNLQNQIKEFQKTYSLEINGKADKATIAKLNSAVDDSILQISFSMDKLRAQKKYSDNRYIIVNLPEFRLHAYKSGKQEFTMPVIVGSATNPTPEFSNNIETIVLNPDWTPTEKISKELITKMRNNPSFLAKSGYEVKWRETGEVIASEDLTAMDWSQVDSSQIKIRQQNGDSNALGFIKFLMPNSDSIYLHDTNTRKLFKNAFRALSHGCIRLAEPFKLAEFVLGEETYKQKNIDKKIGKTGSEYFKTDKVPVYSTYQTAWFDDDGSLNISPDIYKKAKKFESEAMSAKTLNSDLLAWLLSNPASYSAAVNVHEVASGINPTAP